jgi:hypothetical protein
MYIILLGVSGPLLSMAGMSPLFYSFILHTYIRYTLRYFCIFFLQFTLLGGSGPLVCMAGMSPIFY